MNTSLRGKLFQAFLTAVTDSLIYFLAAVTGIACFLVNCWYAGALILGLLAIRLALGYHARRQFNEIELMFSDLMSMTQNFNSNVVNATVH